MEGNRYFPVGMRGAEDGFAIAVDHGDAQFGFLAIGDCLDRRPAALGIEEHPDPVGLIPEGLDVAEDQAPVSLTTRGGDCGTCAVESEKRHRIGPSGLGE